METCSKKDDSLEEWGVTRQKGKRHYVWCFGVCWWGGIQALGWTGALIIQGILRGNAHWAPFLFALIAGPAGGYLLGRINWNWYERKYLAWEAEKRLQ